MNTKKLFHVLVVGGALLGGSSAVRAETPVPDPTQGLAEGQGKPLIFCTNEKACPKDASGVRKVKEGFACCWGTSCDNVK